jgi:NitT/TauT family transport system ATP-binding protein
MIEFRNVSVTFAADRKTEVTALADVSLTVEPGEFLAIVGPSGCGKSTLLNLAAGLLQPSSGAVLFDQEAIVSANTRVGYMTQQDTLLPWRTVDRNVSLAMEIRRMPRAKSRSFAQRCIDLVGLSGFEKHWPAQLSGGMRRRVALASILTYEPPVLLMDEPFGALDAQLKLIMQDEILKIWARTQQTVVFVTHDLAEAVMLADRVAVMTSRPGRIKAVEEIPLDRPRDVFHGRYTPRFSELYNKLWDALEEDIKKGTEV